MDSDAESPWAHALTLLELCDRLQDLLINNDMKDLPVMFRDDAPVTDAWVTEFNPGERVVWLR